jgi:hypothetical protein
MCNHQNLPLDPGYKVDVNPDAAFTITYDDDRGRLLFSIEFGDDPRTVILNPRPSEGSRMVEMRDEATKARSSLAIERVKAYFNAQGLNVEVDEV